MLALISLGCYSENGLGDYRGKVVTPRAFLNGRNWIMDMPEAKTSGNTFGVTSATVDISKEKLMDDLRVVVADAEELLKATANQTGERIAAARAKAGESLQAAKERLGSAQVAVVEKTKAAATATDNYVHVHPWQAVGIAAAVGLLLGAIISRR